MSRFRLLGLVASTKLVHGPNDEWKCSQAVFSCDLIEFEKTFLTFLFALFYEVTATMHVLCLFHLVLPYAFINKLFCIFVFLLYVFNWIGLCWIC